MKKVLSSTPIPAFVIFLLFCIWFKTLLSIYQVDVYQEYEAEIVESHIEEEYLVLKMKSPPSEGKHKVKLVCSDEEPALRGTIRKIEDGKVTVYFEDLSRISKKKLEKATFEFEVGKEPIGEELNVWK